MMLSSSNSKIRFLRKLINDSKFRWNENLLVVEGERYLKDLLLSGVLVKEIFASRTYFDKSNFKFREIVESSVPVNVIEDKLFKSISDSKTPQGVLAVVEMPDFSWKTWNHSSIKSHMLVLVDVADPGNLGTLIRSSIASGCYGIAILGNSTDITSPKVVRSSAGLIFRNKIVVDKDIDQSLIRLKELGWELLATSVLGDVKPYYELIYNKPAFVLGNESHGLNENIVEFCDQSVTIPLANGVESLNVGVAGAILGFDFYRRHLMESTTSTIDCHD